jgi:tetratricopeptide (TPR) repeat protein
MRLSLSMIVRDEEATIGRVLEQTAEFCDELVVVDTGSVDATRSIAEAAGARVLDFEWVDDFAAARQFSWDACTGDWVLWLDADDVIPPEARLAYRELKDELSDDIDALWAPYLAQFDPLTGACVYALNRERVVRRVAGVHWVGPVHESLVIPGNRHVLRADLCVEHRPPSGRGPRKAQRNLAILQRSVAQGDHSSRTLFYLGNELRDAGRYPEAIDAYRQYLHAPGPSWEAYAAELSLARCALALDRGDETMASLQDAVRREPSRAEAYMALGRIHYDRQEWGLAVPFYTAAASAVRPDVGFVQETDYSWGPWDLLGVCLAHLGRHREAIDAIVRSLRAGNPDRERLEANLRWSAAHLSR